MKKVVIDGMSCTHCSSRVEKMLNSIPGVNATVSLENKIAEVTGEVSDEMIKSTIEDAGFEVVSIN